MKKALIDYPFITNSESPKIFQNKNLKFVCFNFQVQAVNVTSYKHKVVLEENVLQWYCDSTYEVDAPIDEEMNMETLTNQESIVKRLTEKSDKLSSAFFNGLANAISSSFILPEHIIKTADSPFINESDLKRLNIEIIPLNKAELMRVLIYINRFKENNSWFKLSDMQLLDLVTIMLCAFLKIEHWYLSDTGGRFSDLNHLYMNPFFQESLKDCNMHPTLITTI